MYHSWLSLLFNQLLRPVLLQSCWEPADFASLSYRHAIATPLTILQTSFEELESCSGDAYNQVITRAKSAAVHLEELTREFSVAGCHNVYDIKLLLSEIKLLLDSTLQNVQLIFTTEGRDDYCLQNGNKVRVAEALTCIIKNSLQASAQGGAVVVICHTTDNCVHITVKDFGCGMKLWEQLVAFLPKVSFKATGSGIGLAYARTVIEKELKGTINIFSQPGKGTCVEITIPRDR